MKRKIIKLTALSLILWPLIASADVITYDNQAAFTGAIGDSLATEDWSSLPVNTVLEGQTIDGVYYHTSSAETLVVGSPHGPSWRLGYLSDDGIHYRSFSTQTISFNILAGVDSFGIALSQGNSSGSTSYVGYSLWDITIDGGAAFTARVDYDLADFSGETYYGLDGLQGANQIDVRRVFSTANIVWDIRSIAYSSVTPVPEPATLALFGLGLAGIGFSRRRKA